ncbi:S8 family peptidase [Laceyella putida]|uniref:S8 family peptidase n=1 Tax=Laceyella putida TaxID=110101 RepID=A0ABW2RG65_9BACL
MKPILGLVTTLSLALSMVPLSSVASATPAIPSPHNKPGEIIVKFKPHVSKKRMEALHSKTGSHVEETSKLGFQVLKVKNSSLKALLQKYKQNPDVEYAEPNYIYHASLLPTNRYPQSWQTRFNITPNDPGFWTKQWGPKRVQAHLAWNATQSNGTVKIAVVDTGVQSTHPDLRGKVLNGWDFVENDNSPQDANGHGTHCAGIIAAATNNRVGIAGMAPNAKLLPVRVLNGAGEGTVTDVADGIKYAADQGAKVINLSLGGPESSSTIKSAVDYAWSKGAVVVAAAGNESTSQPSYPAYYSNAIAVASTNPDDTRSSFSNYGTWVDVAAPGANIYSTINGSAYAYESGTSMAAPHVAGIAGLLASQGRTNVQIRAAIENTADKVPGTGTNWTHGRVNAYKAVSY